MILESNGAIRLQPTSYYERVDWIKLRLWCHEYARYGLPTVELVQWLKSFIGDRKAIEIGAGSGDLCFHLGIKGVDNKQQTWPEVQMAYVAMGQPTIKYGAWVETSDAVDAVRKHKPDIVIGSWITHWFDPRDPDAGGNMFGIKEQDILSLADTYIMIGNLSIHGKKPILKIPHREWQFDFVKSRAMRPTLDRIFIWSKNLPSYEQIDRPTQVDMTA